MSAIMVITVHHCCTGADAANACSHYLAEAEDLVDELPTQHEAAAFPEVVRTKTFSLPPMTLEEALVQVRRIMTMTALWSTGQPSCPRSCFCSTHQMKYIRRR